MARHGGEAVVNLAEVSQHLQVGGGDAGLLGHLAPGGLFVRLAVVHMALWQQPARLAALVHLDQHQLGFVAQRIKDDAAAASMVYEAELQSVAVSGHYVAIITLETAMARAPVTGSRGYFCTSPDTSTRTTESAMPLG